MSTATWQLQPLQQLEACADPGFNWRSTGTEPVFEMKPPGGAFPCGPVLLRTRLFLEGAVPPLVRLFLDTGRGFHTSQSIPLAFRPGRDLTAIVELPHGLRGLRLAMPPCPAKLFLAPPRVRPIGYWEAVGHLGWARLRTRTWTWGGMWRAIRRALRASQPDDRRAVVQFCQRYQLPLSAGQSYQDWARLYDTLDEGGRNAFCARLATWPEPPLISVLMASSGDPGSLRATVASLQQQLYTSWELCLSLTGETDAEVLSADDRIRVHRCSPGAGTATALDQALALASGEWVLALDPGGRLSEEALFLLAEEAGQAPAAALIYTDEDQLDDQGLRVQPHFKPDWNPDLFASHPYLGCPLLCRTGQARAAGGFGDALHGAESYDLVWRILERQPDIQIRHLPHVLYHGPVPAREKASLARAAACHAAAEHICRAGIRATVEPNPLGPWGHRMRYALPDPAPLVTWIVPTRDKPGLLARCVEGLREKTAYRAWQLIIVDNQSREPETLRLFQTWSHDPRIRVLPYDHPFNYSAINNAAAREARGELLGFLNNDIEMLEPGWLDEMVTHAVRPEIGAVGARLRFPDETLQHGGVVLGMCGWAGHLHYGLPPNQPGYQGRAILAQDLCAVTGACLLTRRTIFEQVGGFEERLAVTFNDVDLCLRIRALGLRILWTPHALLRHHETATRGLTDTLEKQQRAESELRFMLERWGPLFHDDPHYNPNLSLAWQDFSPAFPPRVQKPWLNTAKPQDRRGVKS
jgi:GT2 family glycosyltransferase